MSKIRSTTVFLFAVSAVTLCNSQDFQALPTVAPSSKKNPATSAKVELGKKLFFDPRLSLTGTVSCNSCHNVMEGGDDGRITSMGIQGRQGTRNAPTVWNSVFQHSQFWDGRATSLEEQAKGPLVAEPEMGMPDHKKVVDRISAIPGYNTEFADVFGSAESVTIDNAAKAIAAFERTLITPNSSFDRFLSGDDSAMSDLQRNGMELFQSVGCTECHSGPALNGWDPKNAFTDFQDFPRSTDNEYVRKYDLLKDRGRADVTGDEGDAHLYKVPTLRNITLTAPYFHNGSVGSLSEAVHVMAATELDTKLSPNEVKQIVAFLASLEGEFPVIIMPRLPSKAGATIIDDEVLTTANKPKQGE